jgi:mRNA interferase HigB
MRVITRKRLREFWEGRGGDAAQAQQDLEDWYEIARANDPANFAGLRAAFPKADQVGDCVVFNVGGNRYRLIGRVRYRGRSGEGRIFVLRIMDHKDYDRLPWRRDCGCDTPAPRRPRRGR